MIFITLGSQKFQFNRVLKKVDELIEKNIIDEEVFAQIGCSDYKPKKFEYKDFLDREDFVKFVQEANIVITHGGTGAIINAIKQGKRVIALPRLAKYGEHVDNHQIQLVKEFEKLNLISMCINIDDLGDAIKVVKNKKFDKYISNNERIIHSIDQFIIDNFSEVKK